MRRTERAGMEAVFAADALALIMENNAVLSDIKALFRTDVCAGCISAVHTGDRMGGFLALYALMQGNHPSPVRFYWQIVRLGAGNSTGEALYATFCI